MIDAERYRRIDEIFQAALELDPTDRSSYITQVCDGDESLRKEVEFLLASVDKDWELIGTPSFEMVAPLLARNQPELKTGDSIGHYKVASLLGVGGMGQVYLAEDVTLGRKVALKLLPASYTRDTSRLRRFQQEARAASSLNHPNILTIHELGEVNGQQFIATEFVEGLTLRERLKRTPSNLAEILDIAIQIAGALAAAHKAGIVHRDIKPENIMLREDGYVKVLDFGLAKLTEQPDPQVLIHAEDVNISSGLVMGTVKYMSPEQARGQQVDSRSDIFSFGVVLYEMFAGRAPFEGKESNELITAIVKKEPKPLGEASEEIQRVVSRALQKKKEDRYQTIQDLLVDLKALREPQTTVAQVAPQKVQGSALSTGGGAPVSTATTLEYVVSEIKRHKTSAAFVLASLAVLAVGLTFSRNPFSRKVGADSGQMKITRIPDTDKAQSVAISPNGEYIAYAEGSIPRKPSAQQSLWVLEVATNRRAEIVPPADVVYGSLTYSPNGGEIFYNNKGVLYRLPAGGGEPTRVLSNVAGAISFAPDATQFAFVKSLNEETFLMVAKMDGSGERILAQRTHPHFLGPDGPAWSPDGRLIVCVAAELAKNNKSQLIGFDAKTGEEKKVTDQTWDEILGRILWLPDGSGLIAAGDSEGADEQIWEILFPGGEAHRITSDPNHEYLDLSLTGDGKNLITIQTGTRSSIWVAPEGNPVAAAPITSGEHHLYRNVRWTPDGRILYASNIGQNRDIWIMNGDGTNPKQLTDAGVNMQPAPSGDGRYVVFSSNRANDGAYNLWRMDIDGRNPIQLTHGRGEGQPSCSPDGRWVVYSQGGPNTTPWEKTLWKVSIDGGESVQLIDKPSSAPSISPDGKLIACWYSPEAATQNSYPPLKIAIIPFAGGASIKVLDATWTPPPKGIRWTPDGQAITYVKTQASVSNIWSQPVNGDPPQELTQFTSEQIDGFDWSSDVHLLCARNHSVGDVVLISNFK